MKKKLLISIALMCFLVASACAGIFVMAGNKSNTLTIYYSGYSTPYMHYQVGNGAWTDVPGVAMQDSFKYEGFPYELKIDMGSADTVKACFNDGNGNWDNNNSKDYTFEPGKYLFANGQIEKIQPDELSLVVDTKDIHASYFTSYVPMFINGGSAPYTLDYNIRVVQGGSFPEINCADTITLESDTDSAYHAAYFTVSYTGTVYFDITVTDSEGEVLTYNETYEIPKFQITDIETTLESPQCLGQSIELSAVFENAYVPKYGIGSTNMMETYTISRNGYETTDTTTLYRSAYTGTDAIWTPSQAGTYTINVSMKDATGQTSSYSTEYVIKNEEKDYIQIYYKGLDNPYAHYQVGDGSWTSLPGVAMSPSTNTECFGSEYKTTISLGDSDTATVCFNDGNNNWDNNNSANYVLEGGCYFIAEGNVKKMPENFTADFYLCSPLHIGYCYTSFYLRIFGGTAPYTYSYTLEKPELDGTVSTTTDSGKLDYNGGYGHISALFNQTGEANISITVKDSAGETYEFDRVILLPEMSISSIESDIAQPHVGDSITFTSICENRYFAQDNHNTKIYGTYKITNNTTNETTTIDSVDAVATKAWVPGEAGTYTVLSTITDSNGAVATYSTEIVVEDVEKNIVTVYYKGFENPYIHYAINGSWTNVPGIKMTEKSDIEGYDYMFSVETGDADTITACFNDGNGNWDSNNGQNYIFNIGDNFYIK